jgi:hypothetical protein
MAKTTGAAMVAFEQKITADTFFLFLWIWNFYPILLRSWDSSVSVVG